MKKNPLNNFLASGIQFKENDFQQVRIRFFNIIGLLAIVVIGGFGVTNIIVKDYVPAFIEFLIVIIALTSILYVRSTKNLSLIEYSGPIIVLIITLQNMVTGGFEQTGILFMMPYPMVVYFITGAKKGTAWVAILLSLMFVILILNLQGIVDIPYSQFTILMTFIALILMSVLIAVYQNTYEQTAKLLMKEREKLAKTKDELEQTIRSTNSTDKQLKHTVSKMTSQKNLLEDTQKAILNVLEDIEEEKEQTEQQKDELEKFKEAVDNASDHIMITDPDGHIVYANVAVEDITGYSLKEIIGKTPALWGKQMSEDFYKKFWHRIKDEQKPYNGEIVNRRKNGEKYIAQIHIAPIIEDDKVKAFVGIERDVTKEKEIDRMKTDFVSVASHQLRTPLTGIKWFLEVLKDKKMSGELSKTQEEYIDSIGTSTDRMIVLVNDLLNVSRIDSGRKFDITRKKENIIPTIDSAIKENKVLAEKAKVKLIHEKNLPSKLNLYIDSQKIFEVFKNIINNAIKYSSQGDSVYIGLKEDKKDTVVFYIKDEGFGIPEKAQKRIFQKFFRAENVIKEQTDGSGLGLYIARAIINGHNGKISFESKQGKGTTFFIELPKAKPIKKEELKKSSLADEVKSEINEALLDNKEASSATS